MESKVRLLGHSVHPMLVVFPLGLLFTSVVFDAIYLATGNVVYAVVAHWNIATGLIAGLIAGVVGFIDWLAIPKQTRARTVGAVHGLGNVVVLGLFAAAWLARRDEPHYGVTALPFTLELLGGGLAMVTGWLGGELVARHGVGVDPGANLNATSSLSGKPANRRAPRSR